MIQNSKKKALIKFFLSIMLTGDYDEIIRNYSEHVHDYWCFSKVNSNFKIDETKAQL